MRKKIIAGLLLSTMIFSLTACSSSEDKKETTLDGNKETIGVGKYFECLEDTIKEDSFDFDFSIYEADVTKVYFQEITKCTDEDNTYFGYNDDSYRNQGYGFYEYAYYGDKFYDLDDDSIIDVTAEENKYDGEGDLSEEYVIYKCMKALESEDINDVMENVTVFESAEGIPAYRTYKQGIEKVISLYDEDESSISFIKEILMSDEEFKLTMYAMDFYLWCEENLDSYIISSEMKEALSSTELSKVTVTINIKLDGDYVSEYKYYHEYPNVEMQDGVEICFNNINQLGKDSNLMLLVLDGDKYEQAVNKAIIENCIQMIKDVHEEHPEYRFTYPCGSVYGEDDYLGCYNITVYGYNYTGGGNFGSDEEYANAYSAEDMLAYLENGTPLPENTVSENTTPDWKKVYLDYFEQTSTDFKLYKLVDVNGDDIPEICFDIMNVEGMSMYYLNKDNEVKMLDDMGYMTCGDKYIFIERSRIEFGNIAIYEYDSSTGNYNIVFDGRYTADVNGENKEYFVDDVECSEDEYQSQIDNYKNKNNFFDLGDFEHVEEGRPLIQAVSEY